MKKSKYNSKVSILFVDDNSYDGTLIEIKSYQKKNKKNLSSFKKKNVSGISSQGWFKMGYKKNFDYICTLDCDGTHDPKDISKMLKLIKSVILLILTGF